MRKALKMSLLLGTIMVLLALTACGVDGDYKSNKKPTISITSWEGAENQAALDTLETLVFQQRIYWNTNDNDGTVTGIAYRILDENGDPISTPGNSVIDEMGDLEPVVLDDGQQVTGWVVHYRQGADENIPLTSENAKKTIWSQRQYAVVNFPANEDGQPIEAISTFEVICIDNAGDVSNIARKSFKTTSDTPNCILSTSRGNPNGKQVGTGLYITFSMSYPSEALDPIPGADFYEYKMAKYYYDEDADSTDTPVMVEGSETEWFITDNREILLTKDTNPALSADFDGTETDANQETFTRVTAHAYNYAGVKSNESIIDFAVKEGFHPKTLIYSQKTYGMGDNHYKDYVSSDDLENYPYILKDGPIPIIYATSFFTDAEGRHVAVNSTNFKFFAKWGFSGQYGNAPTSSTGAFDYTDNPYDTELGRVRNEADDKDYFSEIVAFDIRFDDEPFDFYALSQDPNNTVTHEDGSQWLRVPKNSVWSISKGLELGNLDSGMHKLEISAVDLQYEYDPTPAVFEFELKDYIPVEEREIIVVVDGSRYAFGNELPTYTDSIYAEALADYANVEFWERAEIVSGLGLNPEQYCISYPDLVNVKTLIYREESTETTENFIYDHDAIKLFLNNGGNLILSSPKLQGLNNTLTKDGKNLFRKFFGINNTASAVVNLTSPIQTPFIIGASPTDDAAAFGNLPEFEIFIGPHYPTLIAVQGLIDVSFFAEDYAVPEDNETKIIYRSVAKEIQAGVPFTPQTQEAFDRFNDVPLAVGKITPQNKCLVTGFPISFMKMEGIKQLFDEVLND